MNVIGITGTLGAGKGTIVDLLKDEYSYAHYSVRDYLIEVIRDRGMEVNRDSMTMVANELRANNSPSFFTYLRWMPIVGFVSIEFRYENLAPIMLIIKHL
ncbi:MAG: hypothetical protein B6I18_00420 [Bacteroidetes bacterium 4572_112]|nr:MAG: hypothetical protein B6I18_00420 [Bacteroidetes bacterium 4572_112]